MISMMLSRQQNRQLHNDEALVRRHRPEGKRPGSRLEALLETRLHRALPRIISLALLWLRRSRHRHELERLDAAQLKDVGLSAHLVQREAAKPFWQG